jgi:hypothetical protein
MTLNKSEQQILKEVREMKPQDKNIIWPSNSVICLSTVSDDVIKIMLAEFISLIQVAKCTNIFLISTGFRFYKMDFEEADVDGSIRKVTASRTFSRYFIYTLPNFGPRADYKIYSLEEMWKFIQHVSSMYNDNSQANYNLVAQTLPINFILVELINSRKFSEAEIENYFLNYQCRQSSSTSTSSIHNQYEFMVIPRARFTSVKQLLFFFTKDYCYDEETFEHAVLLKPIAKVKKCFKYGMFQILAASQENIEVVSWMFENCKELRAEDFLYVNTDKKTSINDQEERLLEERNIETLIYLLKHRQSEHKSERQTGNDDYKIIGVPDQLDKLSKLFLVPLATDVKDNTRNGAKLKLLTEQIPRLLIRGVDVNKMVVDRPTGNGENTENVDDKEIQQVKVLKGMIDDAKLFISSLVKIIDQYISCRDLIVLILHFL